MNAPAALELPLGLPPPWWVAAAAPPTDWLAAYREAEAAALAAAAGVRAACDRYKAARDDATAADYRTADQAYDRARLAFQVASFQIASGIRAIAGIARHMQLADAGKRRML